MDRKTLGKYLFIAEGAAFSAGKYLSDYKRYDISIESEQGEDND